MSQGGEAEARIAHQVPGNARYVPRPAPPADRPLGQGQGVGGRVSL